MKYIQLRGKYGLGKQAIVSDIDYDRCSQYKWTLSFPNGNRQFARTRIGNKSCVSMSRFITNPDKNILVDHRNGNTLDNRRENLRFCNNAQNQMNSKLHRDKKSINGIIPPKGIKFDASRPHKPWVGRIYFQGRRILTKGFSEINDAVKAYQQIGKKYFGDFFNPGY